MAMSVTLMVWGTMLTSLMIWVNTRYGLRPWVGWARVHSNWSRVRIFLWTSLPPQSHWIKLLCWWAIPVSTVISFIFLGFGEEARKEYRRVGEVIVRMIPSRVLPRGKKEIRKGTVLIPLRPPVYPRSVSPTLEPIHSHPLQRSLDGPPTPHPANLSATSPRVQEPPPTQLQSSYSMIGLPPSRAQSRSSGKLGGWRWSARSEGSGHPPLQPDDAEGRPSDYISGLGSATVAEPQRVIVRESAQGSIERREAHEQV